MVMERIQRFQGYDVSTYKEENSAISWLLFFAFIFIILYISPLFRTKKESEIVYKIPQIRKELKRFRFADASDLDVIARIAMANSNSGKYAHAHAQYAHAQPALIKDDPLWSLLTKEI